jgi:Xaa-Pro aminopeptidase
MTHQIQQFHVKGGPQYGRENLPKLRASLAKAGLDGFLIPHEDEYNNEYLPANAERLAWATGFTGSAGAAAVLGDVAAVFVDGRYTEQVKSQVDQSLFDYEDLVKTGMAGWIRKTAKPGQTIGYDPRLHSPDALTKLQDAADKTGAKLVAVETNPIDQAWENRPAAPLASVHPQPLDVAGEAHGDKRKRIGEDVKDDGADAAVITDPASIAWLFNVRGGDVACTPLPLSSAIIEPSGQATLFINEAKLTDDHPQPSGQ